MGGAVYPDMGRSLYESEPVFKEVVTNCSAFLRNEGYTHDISLAEAMYPETWSHHDRARIEKHPLYNQCSLFALEVGLGMLWKSKGVSPNYIIGHSLGEYAGAVIAEIFSL